MVCEPVVVDENGYVAEPFASVRAGVCGAPSTVIVRLPVGVAVLEPDPDATVMVTTSLVPTAGVVVAAESTVVEATTVTVTLSEPLDVP